MAKLGKLQPLVARIDMRTAQPAKKLVDPLYASQSWRELVALLLAIRGHRCEKCDRSGVRIYGDHIKEIRDGGAPLDPANVQLLCGSCHTKKTIEQRAKRMAGPVT